MNNEEIKKGVAKLKEMHTAYWIEKKKPGNENKPVLQQTVGSFGADNDGKKLLIYLTKSVCGRALPDYTEKISYTNITETANSKSEEGKVPVKGYSRCYLMSKEEMDVSGISLYATYNILEEKAYEFSIKLDLEGKALSKNCKDNLKSFKEFADEKCKSRFEWEDRPDYNLKIPKMVIDLSKLENEPESINDMIKNMQDALIILKACYKYVLSGNPDILTKIVDLIASMDRINDPNSPVALSTTMIALDDLIFDDCKQIVLTGAPGTGKTYSAQEYIKWQLMTEYITNNEGDVDAFNDEWDKSENSEGKLADRWRMVQFHPSFDYTDFVEGLRPIELNNSMQFKRMDGIFKEFCRTVAKENGDKDPKKCPKRFFLIDEINRADLSKVFGELMFCLEEDYRGKSHTIKTQYSNLDTCDKSGNPIKDDKFVKGFYIPENVIIIGTMNDIDRSVDTFDFALRRRFRWVNVEVNETLLTTTFLAMNKKNDSLKTEEEISGFVKSIMDMNSVFSEDQFKRIFKTPKDYYVGPAYFKGLFKNDTKDAIWRNKIEPLLREYVRGRNEADDFIKACREAFLPETQKAQIDVSEKIKSVTAKLLKNEKFSGLPDDEKLKWQGIINGIATELSKNSDYGFKKGDKTEKLKTAFISYTDNLDNTDNLVNWLEENIDINWNNVNKQDEFWNKVKAIIIHEYENYLTKSVDDESEKSEQ